MKNYSIWLDDIKDESIIKLDKDKTIDVLIIGGGITGISCAYELRKSGLKVALVEKNRIGRGVTARTTGKLTFLQELAYSNLKNLYNLDVAKKYLKSQQDAIKNVKDIIEKKHIDCSFNMVSSYVFTNLDSEEKKIRKEKEVLEEMGVKVSEHSELPDSTKVLYGISVDDTAVFNPLKYVCALKDICKRDNVDIYENTKVVDISKDNGYFVCKTESNVIKAKKVVLAVHYPYFLVPYFFPLKVTLEKSYIGAFKVEKNLLFSAITSSKPTTSIRYLDKGKDIYKFYLINSHNLAFSNNEKKNFQELMNFCKNKKSFVWSNVDILTSDKLPFVGEINEGLYLATGYNTWGMTNGTLAGKIISDLVCGKSNRYKQLFNPRRGLNKNSLIKFPINIVSNVKSFGGSKINSNKSWYSDRVMFIRENGKNLGIYVDEEGVEHVVNNICPHLKCSLIFNEVEKTWDCPCHGSRFDIDGKCIEGPSNYDISYKDTEK